MTAGDRLLRCPYSPRRLARTPGGNRIATTDCPEICDDVLDCVDVYVFYPCDPNFDTGTCLFAEDRLYVCPTQTFYDVDTGTTGPISAIAGGGILMSFSGDCYYTDGILVAKTDAIADGIVDINDTGTSFEIHSALDCDSAECVPGPTDTCGCICACYGPSGEVCCYGLRDDFDGRVTLAYTYTETGTIYATTTADYVDTAGSCPVALCNAADIPGTTGGTYYAYERRLTGSPTYGDCSLQYAAEQRTTINKACYVGTDTGSPTWTATTDISLGLGGLSTSCLPYATESDNTTVYDTLGGCVFSERVQIIRDGTQSCTRSAWYEITTTRNYISQVVGGSLTCTCSSVDVLTKYASLVLASSPGITTREARLCDLCGEYVSP